MKTLIKSGMIKDIKFCHAGRVEITIQSYEWDMIKDAIDLVGVEQIKLQYEKL
jgi:hypothetical protein